MRRLGIFAAGASAALMMAVACSDAQDTGGDGAGSDADAAAAPGEGALHVTITLPVVDAISEISYRLSNQTVTYTGKHRFDDAGMRDFTLGDVPAGSGYALSINAVSDDSVFFCSFPAAGQAPNGDIVITSGHTTDASVDLQCVITQGLNSGDDLVNPSTSQCAVWNSIVVTARSPTQDGGLDAGDGGFSVPVLPGDPADPIEVAPGQQLVLTGNATAPNPGAIAFVWSTTGGTIVGAPGNDDLDTGIANQATFTCPQDGGSSTNVITMTLSDGETVGNCDSAFTTATVTVTCPAAPHFCDADCDARASDATDDARVPDDSD